MLITARSRTGTSRIAASMGHATSSDLVTWQVQPALSQPGSGFMHLEVFQYLEVEGTGHIVLLLRYRAVDRTPCRQRGGIWTFPVANFPGPVDPSTARLLVGEELYAGRVALTEAAGRCSWPSTMPVPAASSAGASAIRCRCAWAPMVTSPWSPRHEHRIQGTVAPGFEPVSRRLRRCVRRHPTMAQRSISAARGNRLSISGARRRRRATGRRWTADTPSVVFSLHQGPDVDPGSPSGAEGRLAYHVPASRYWPEYAAEGKSESTVADLLSHRAGLTGPRQDLTFEDLLDWDRHGRHAGPRQYPLWCPGTAYAYHAITHGWLVGELVRRVTGLSPGQYFRTLVTEPLGVDAWIGLPVRAGRPAHLQVAPSITALSGRRGRKTRSELALPRHDHGRRAAGRPGDARWRLHQHPRLQAAEIPGAGGIATARALATIWSATTSPPPMACGCSSPTSVALATQTQSAGAPFFAADPPFSRWGMGFQLDSEARR